MVRHDRIFGAVLLAVSVFYIWAASQTQLSFITDPVGPRVFPMLVGVVAAICCIVMMLRPDPNPVWPGFARVAEIGAAAAVFFIYAMVLPELGFVLCTAIAAGYLCWRLGGGILEAIIAGCVMAVGIYAVFHWALGLSLAKGPWGF